MQGRNSGPRLFRHRELNGLSTTHHAIKRSWYLRKITHFQTSRDYSYVVWHRTACTALALERVDDRYLLTSGLDAAIGLWDTRPDIDDLTARTSRGRIQPIGSVPRTSQTHDRAITSLAWYPGDSGIFVSGSASGIVKVWDTNRLEEATQYTFPNPVNMTECTSALIAVATQDPQIRICDMRVGSSIQTLQGHDREVQCVAWYPLKRDRMLVSGSRDGSIRLWDIRQGKAEVSVINQGSVSRDKVIMGAAIEPLGNFLVAVLSSGQTEVWDVNAQQQMCGMQTNYRPTRAMIPGIMQESHVISGYFVPTQNQSISYIDISPNTPKLTEYLVGRSFGGTFTTGAVFCQNRMLVLACDDLGSVHCYDTRRDQSTDAAEVVQAQASTDQWSDDD